MTVTVLDHALLADDAGRVTGKRQERPDPEVSENAAVIPFPLVARQCRLAKVDHGSRGVLVSGVLPAQPVSGRHDRRL
ncbi:MAG: hypothetical protein ACRDRJ_24410 [Streptosporangiaceae bacterium]